MSPTRLWTFPLGALSFAPILAAALETPALAAALEIPAPVSASEGLDEASTTLLRLAPDPRG